MLVCQLLFFTLLGIGNAQVTPKEHRGDRFWKSKIRRIFDAQRKA